MYEELLRDLNLRKGQLHNLVGGRWLPTKKERQLVSPINGSLMCRIPDTQPEELAPFLESLKTCPKSGRHNPIKNIERYVMLGEVFRKAAHVLKDPDVVQYFTNLIRFNAMPKSYLQAKGEVVVTANGLANFSGDNVRFLAVGKTSPGDHFGQQPQDYNWPYGPVAIISPFNFPLEIPALQIIGALAMGNKPVVKPASTVGVVVEQFLMLLHYCGLPLEDVDLLHCSGKVMNEFLKEGNNIIRLVQFTGSSKTAEEISLIMHGKVRLEDAGFDWKILGPDYKHEYFNYVAWQCDQDAYSASGQKCSATSILFAHDNWVKAGLYARLKDLASTRNLIDLTVGPVLSWTTKKMLDHISALLQIPGACLLFGGKELVGHRIPKEYGAIEPTAVYVPFDQIEDHFELVTTEVFGPFQVVTSYGNRDLPKLLEYCERMENHLAAAVVSDDPVFINKVLGSTVNGTTYAGIRARTTGAPQNHFFGPSGDPRGAGIGTPDAIIRTWSAPRCIIRDVGPITGNETLTQS